MQNASVPFQEGSSQDELDCPQGLEEEGTKRKSQEKLKSKGPNVQLIPRAVAGASLADVMAQRNQKPKVRKAQWGPAFRAAKKQKQTETT